MTISTATWQRSRSPLGATVLSAIAAVGVTLVTFGQSAAQTAYPSKVIKIILPFASGGPPDAAARVVVQHLQSRIGQSVIIENRPGAGTTIGTMAVATAAPDGYTLLFNGSNLFAFPVLYPNLDFDPIKSLAPVATAVTWSHVMVVAPSVPAKTIDELIAYAKANPGKLNFGFGLGTTPQILGESFKRATGTDIAFIPYRGGEQARADLLGGRVHINMAPVASLLPLIQEGKARPLAFTGPARSPDLPDVPTMIESGLPQVGYNPDTWLGFLAPAGTPTAVISKLNTEINSILKSPEMKAALARLGFEAQVTTLQEFAVFLAAEQRKWPPLLGAAGFKAE
ncbi:MAG: extra-cytoplasmic solute receptor [Betaproteobacteria bacterium]|nr:extra-cytoplasmic solute receptor [Betaproteobacteria bacterium]